MFWLGLICGIFVGFIISTIIFCCFNINKEGNNDDSSVD